MFIRRCAWHPKYHGYSKILGVTWSGWGIEFSHGICSDCAARTRAEWRLPTEAQTAALSAPRRPLRSLRPDFALAAAVVLLAITATFALVGVPGYRPPAEQRSAGVDRAKDSADASGSGASTTNRGSSAGADGSATTGGGPAGRGGALASSGVRPPTTSSGGRAGETAPQVAEAPPAPGPEPSGTVSGAGRPSRGRVIRARSRGVAGGSAAVRVSAPDLSPSQDEAAPTRVAAAPHTHVPASAPDLPGGPSNFGRHGGASRFNEVQAP